MFCTSLRRRSSFASVVPLLAAPSGLAVKESMLETHDIAIPIPEFPKAAPDTKSKRMLRLLLLSPNSMSEEQLPATIARIQHFVILTGGLDVAIVMSLSVSKPFSSAKDLLVASELDDMNGIQSYARLQAELLTKTELTWVPILPLVKLDGIVELIKIHAQSISRPKPKPSSAVRPMDMLAHCTTDPPLSSLAINLASDTFPCLSNVAQAALDHDPNPSLHDSGEFSWSDDSTQSHPGQFKVLDEQLGPEIVGNMIDFWIMEWAIE
ncbi:hypothetical protein QM012_008961 [Aureobasidium pullulans]|uniref:Uncharacterized protein n=1 Tax=Aureobasidium pullulans TaxID=5580 RepID=A0ABR0TI33_AURPU